MAQAQKFVFIRRAELEAVLQKFGPIVEYVTTGMKVKETIYQVLIPNTKLVVHVYSSIEKGSEVGRDVGKDAIRVVTLLPTPYGLKPVSKQIRTHRTPGWELRLEKKIQKCIDNIPQYTLCPECNCPLIVRKRRADDVKFFGCTNYPECKYACDMTEGKPTPRRPTTRTVTVGKKVVTITRTCPRCQSPMEERPGKYGVYHSCTNWPKCRFVERVMATPRDPQESAKDARERRVKMSTPSCPQCGREMLRRSGKYGEFWGCPSYPACRGTRNIR